MHSHAGIPSNLNYIYDTIGDKREQYKNAFWLKTDFDCNVWDCYFLSGYKKRIDFNIELFNGSLLTDKKHEALLDTIKYFLCVHTHTDSTGGRIINGCTANKMVSHTIHMIDYLILNSADNQLHEHGLFSLTENDLTNILLKIGSFRFIHQSVYRWSYHLTYFLKMKISSLTGDIISKTIKNHPELLTNEFNKDEKILNLTDGELISARVWLFINKYYRQSLCKSGISIMCANNFKLAKIIYKNTLGGQYTTFTIVPELCFGKIIYSTREYQSVPVRTKNNVSQMGETHLIMYYHTLRHLGILKTIDLPVPYQALQQLKFSKVLELLNLNKAGRYSLLPSCVVLGSLKNAIEFCVKYGNDLVDSYLSVVKAAHDSGKTMKQWHLAGIDITPYLTPTIKDIGVTHWLIGNNVVGMKYRFDDVTHYQALRKNISLWELLRVLYGSIQIIVGTLMARRQGELIDLKATTCLDSQKNKLIFFVRKSGYGDKREKVARPIPAIAVQMILLLERLQIELKNIGIINKFYPIFSHPHQFTNTLVNFSPAQFNRSIDIFCDYMEIPLDKEGRRYYIRQHQLRRFFAMLFFWGSSFGGMDTLRWFLAHTNVEHLYHYVTESTPGDVLRDVKAHYAVEQLQSYDDSATALSDLLEKKFGTRKFDLMDSDELDAYIKNLISEGTVNVEPEFFNACDGNNYRILIKVVDQE
ncbi:MAG: hypothetical protein Q8L78_06445 [Coxiellaceae bacterium]|nr:hypothetical protein [Coxiellaceae bacterium]